MKQKILFLVLVVMYFPFILSQTDSTEDSWQWEMSEELKAWANKKPAISLNYGFSSLSRKDVEAAFADNNLLELKLGYTYKRNKYADYIEKSTFNYLLVNHNSTDLAGGSTTASDIETNNWQFGVGWSGGYGYKVGTDASVTPYYASSFTWTNMDFSDKLLSTNDERVKELYDESIRFGTSSEAGMRVQATKLIVLEAGYEKSIVFERHLFMKWLGSGIIEIAAHSALDIFINEVFQSSPSAGPIVFFVLKSALGYGLYELRKEKMNWPFPSAPPIAFDNIKFGVSLTF
jgi:hypothetical protein